MHIGLNAHLLSAQAGYRTAGIHRYIESLLTALPAAAPQDWHFTALVGAAQPAQFNRITMRRASLDTESPARRILWEQFMQPFSLGQFDLYHALAFVAPLLLSKPMVATIYDLSFIHYPERLPASRRAYLQAFTKITCQRARRILAISQSTAQDVADVYRIPLERIDIAPPGCDFARYRPLPAQDTAAFRQAQDLPERFWLFVGTLEPRKNLITLIEAYAALAPAQRLPLVLAGGKGWDYAPIFDAVEKHHLTDTVRFPGFISPDALPLWYNAAEAFLYPSIFEGFGIPVLEAMACGTPVLVSNASSLPEVVGDAGMCLPASDRDAWSSALIRAAQDADWRTQARERGFAQAAQFTWAQTARVTLESYQKANA
jgi:glycosyltransferase involved in cell wall biosynthesis